MKQNRSILLMILLLIIQSAIYPKDRIDILLPPSYFGFTEKQNAILTEVAIQTAAILNKKYGKFLEASFQPATAQAPYTVEMIPAFAEADSSMMLMLKKRGSTEQPVPTSLSGIIDRNMAPQMAGGIFLQWTHFYNYFKDSDAPLPEFIDEITTAGIKKSILSDRMEIPDLYPQGISTTSKGNILVGLSLADLEMDRYFKILGQPGKALSDEGNYSYAYGVGVTPGNTVYFKPSTGREIYRVIEGLPRPQKWRSNTDLNGPFTVLNDGSVVLANYTEKKSYRIQGKDITELPLFNSPTAMITAITTGPEGSLWVYDGTERKVKIYTPEGIIIDEILPIMPPTEYILPFSFQVYRNGSFIISSTGELYRFNRDGTLSWKIKKIQREFEEALPSTFYFTLDRERGLIYLSDVMGKRVVKLIDTAYCREEGIKNPFEEEILSLNKKYYASEDPEILADKALLYEKHGAFEKAQELWEDILDQDPFHETAAEHLESIEIKILKQNAEVMREKTLEVLERIGPASAEIVYKQALKLYEQIISIDPGNEEAKKELKELKNLYEEKDRIAGKNLLPIKIEKITASNIYPSLIHYYRSNPIGKVVLKNTLKSDITSVRVSVMIQRYMDFPTESEIIEKIKAGESREVNLYAQLNQEIFNIEEDLPKQIEVTVKYEAEGTEQGVTKNGGLTIYRRTSLTWDDSGKLASFIMPNDEIVSGFSHKVLDRANGTEEYKISKKFFRAIRICDALGLYGISYIEDPASPFSRVLGKEEAVDTVRFPRTTLMIRSGDCDDTTALLASLLEAAGIGTAIITSPGHVFLAFDTGEPEENIWQFRTTQFEALAKNSSVWIPIETTVLKKGFRTAWAEASELIRKHSKEIEFLPIAQQREKYPPLPLPGSQFTIIEPDAEIIDPVYKGSVKDVVGNIYEETLSGFDRELNGAAGKTRAKLLVQKGVLHARFGRQVEADEIFTLCQKEFPDYTAGYLNAANLLMEDGNFDGAVVILKKGLSRQPDSVLLNLLMARCYYNSGKSSQVAAYFDKVKMKSSSLAERYSYLTEETGERARSAEDLPPMIWGTEE